MKLLDILPVDHKGKLKPECPWCGSVHTIRSTCKSFNNPHTTANPTGPLSPREREIAEMFKGKKDD